MTKKIELREAFTLSEKYHMESMPKVQKIFVSDDYDILDFRA